jgi:N6-L-threonylcarbamoyladenine synthase
LRVLGIETSCDETSVALVDASGVHANLVSSQIELHGRFGGVVPELASRAHVRNAIPVIEAALEHAGWQLGEIDAVSATAGPGLIGAVLTGLTCGKALAWSLDRPFVGAHHIEAHILANSIDAPMRFPALALVVSGGHTELVLVARPGEYRRLGITRDDAAGETFDKTAKLMGLPYPGGPAIEKLARDGRAGAVVLPRSLTQKGNLEFSFSGLKTAVRLHLESLGPDPTPEQRQDLARGLLDAVVDVLLLKTERALVSHPEVQGLYLAGGVAANGPLRDRFTEVAMARDLDYRPPKFSYCTDNAAMVAWTGRLKLIAAGADGLDLPAFARGGIRSWALPGSPAA